MFVLLTIGPLQHRSIALSTSVSVIVNFLFLSVALYREIEGYPVRYMLLSMIKITIVSVAMGASALWLDGLIEQLMGTGLLAQMVALFAAMAGAILFYFAAISFMGIKEITYLAARIRSRLNF
jgi:putative peptidoglycan lipid II flippase